jgi:hypothetical protein
MDSARHVIDTHAEPSELNRPISLYRLRETPVQNCEQSVSAPRGKARARFNAHTEMRAKRQRSAREAIYRYRPIASYDVAGSIHQSLATG